MRFLPEGVDIPDPLIRAGMVGDAIFLCGAGVSMRSDMPSFRGLAELVYKTLGEVPTNEAAEQTAFDREEFDRALRSLEKRTHPPGKTRSQVRQIVAARLRAFEGFDFANHQALLQISRDSSGRSRLLTTNFDTLFERAATRLSGGDVPSHSGKALPKAGGPRDHGIFHMHGRVADLELGLDETDLVLTSADFGDAYLRDGWASQYIEDRMRLETIILIGYGAEDAAFRLLLETLDADRDRFPDLKDIYAIERKKQNSASFWRAKGIKPIEFPNYDAIYETIEKWSEFASDTIGYANSRLKAILEKLPDDTTEFEREQAQFFLETVNIGVTLAEINPRLVWVSFLENCNLVEFDDPRMFAWILKNISNEQAASDLAEKWYYFGPNTARYLEFHLNEQVGMFPEALLRCWRLIIRGMRNVDRHVIHSEWLELEPRIRRGEVTQEVLERLADVLRPRMKIGRRSPFNTENSGEIRHPTDLLSIEYTVDDDVVEEEILAAWPEEAAAEADSRLLKYLIERIDATLADAVEQDLESHRGLSASDFDVPSIASHLQNEHRSGFLEISRVAAELWTRLAKKDSNRAIQFVHHWNGSNFKLNHRFGLYACADNIVPAHIAFDSLEALPQGDLFLTSAAVEVYRLIKARWSEFSNDQRTRVERRLRAGPPHDWFKEDADIAKSVDRSRFDLLGQMEATGLELNPDTLELLNEIRTRWPKWRLRDEELIGFHSWSTSRSGEIGDPTKLDDVLDRLLVSQALKIDEDADAESGSAWRALCATDPYRALRGLEADSENGDWRETAWKGFFWEVGAISDDDFRARLVELLLKWPKNRFEVIEKPALNWLQNNAQYIFGERLFILWDKFFDFITRNNIDDTSEYEPLTGALGSPVSPLVEILVGCPADQDSAGLSPEVRIRMERMLKLPGGLGSLARARFSPEVSNLYERDAVWVIDNLLPLFDLSFSESANMWSARSYSNYIGSPELIRALKEPFFELLNDADTPIELLQRYAEWLATIAIANQKEDAGYPVTNAEVRSILRKAGVSTLQSVAHKIAREMETTPTNQKNQYWREVIGPVFEGIWPLDIDLRSASLAFKLVQILRATGAAFARASSVILPYIAPDYARSHAIIRTIAKADDILFSSGPKEMLQLISAVVGVAPTSSVYDLQRALDRVSAVDPSLENTPLYQRLRTFAV